MEAMLEGGAEGDAAAPLTCTPSSGGGGRALPRLSFFLRTPPSTHRKTPGGSAGRRLSHASHLFRAGDGTSARRYDGFRRRPTPRLGTP